MDRSYILIVIFLLSACGGSSPNQEIHAPRPTTNPTAPTPALSDELVVELENWSKTGGSYAGFQTYPILNGTGINFNQAGDFGEYKVQLKAGVYSLSINASTPIDETPTQVQLHMNDCLITTSDIMHSGSWSKFRRNIVTENLVVIETGEQTLKIIGWGEPGTWQWNGDKMSLSRTGDVPAEVPDCETPPNLPRNVPPIEPTYDNGIVLGDREVSPSTYSATYLYHIYLPSSYETSLGKEYDLLVVTDGQYAFDPFAKAVDKSQRELIVIGIEDAGRRGTDYGLPFATTYISFLMNEFIPLLSEEFRIKQDNITLEGFSFGGLMAGLSLLLDDPETPVFKNILSHDGFFSHRSFDILNVLDERVRTDVNMHVNLVLTGANVQGLSPDVKSFVSRLKQANLVGLTITERYYDVSHNEIFNEAMTDVLDDLYGPGGPM